MGKKQQPKKQGPRTTQLVSAIGAVIVGAFLMGSLADARSRHNASSELVESGRAFFRAMEGYRMRQGSYPSNGDPLEDTFDRRTFEPLIRDGALDDPSEISHSLKDEQISFYGSPDLPTTNHDFWAILVSRADPSVKVLVADTDEYPGQEGERLRGVYLLQAGRWQSRGL